MKKLTFILLASALTFTSIAQNFSDGSTGKRHKSSRSKPKKQKRKKKSKKSETSLYIDFSNQNNISVCFDNTINKSQEIYSYYAVMNEGTNSNVATSKRRRERKAF